MINRVESLRVPTYPLLRPGDRRRIWVASVSPGYDESNVASRTTHTVVPRETLEIPGESPRLAAPV